MAMGKGKYLLVFLLAFVVLASGCIGGGSKQTTTAVSTTTTKPAYTLSVSEKNAITSGNTIVYEYSVSVSGGAEIKDVEFVPSGSYGQLSFETKVVANGGDTAEVQIIVVGKGSFEGKVPGTLRVTLTNGQVLSKAVTLSVKLISPKFGRLYVPLVTNPVNVSVGREFALNVKFIPYDSMKYSIVNATLVSGPSWLKLSNAETWSDNPYMITLVFKATSLPPEQDGVATVKVGVTVDCNGVEKELLATITFPYVVVQEAQNSTQNGGSGTGSNTTTQNQTQTSNTTVSNQSTSARISLLGAYVSGGNYYVIVKANGLSEDKLINAVVRVNGEEEYVPVETAGQGNGTYLAEYLITSQSGQPSVTINVPGAGSITVSEFTPTEVPVHVGNRTLFEFVSMVEGKGVPGYLSANYGMVGLYTYIMKVFVSTFQTFSNLTLNSTYTGFVPIFYTTGKYNSVSVKVAVPSANYTTEVSLDPAYVLITLDGRVYVYKASEPIKFNNYYNSLIPVYTEFNAGGKVGYERFYLDNFVSANTLMGTTDNESNFVTPDAFMSLVGDMMSSPQNFTGGVYTGGNYTLTFEFTSFDNLSSEHLSVSSVADVINYVFNNDASGKVLTASVWASSLLGSGTSAPLPIISLTLPTISPNPIVDYGYTVIGGNVYRYNVRGTAFTLSQVSTAGKYSLPKTGSEFSEVMNTSEGFSTYDFTALIFLGSPGKANVSAVINGTTVSVPYVTLDELLAGSTYSSAGVYFFLPFGNSVYLTVITSNEAEKIIVNGEAYNISAVGKDWLLVSESAVSMFPYSTPSLDVGFAYAVFSSFKP